MLQWVQSILHVSYLMVLSPIFPPQVVTVAASHAMWKTPVLPEEELLITRAVEKRKREFRAGRHCAHRALEKLGCPQQPILRDVRRAPLWPAGYIGSISHCADLCIAACARNTQLVGLGIDVEPLKPLKTGLADYIQTPTEMAQMQSMPTKLPDRLTFSAKESLYKCYYPLVKSFFGFLSVEILFDTKHQSFQFRPAEKAKISFPGNLEFNGHYLTTETHLITSCYLKNSS